MRPEPDVRPLSPISRRVFLLAAPPFLAACGSGGYADYPDGYPDCIYCDGVGQDYEECDSDYCNHFE